MYDKIKLWHRQGLWSSVQVLQAVEKCVLTEAQADEILMDTGAVIDGNN